MDTKEGAGIIIHGGFAGYLRDIYNVQVKYRALLDKAVDAMDKVEEQFKVGYLGVEGREAERAKAILDGKLLEQEAEEQKDTAVKAFTDAVERFYKPDPLQLKPEVKALLDSGILTEEELVELAADHAGEPTLYRLIYQAAQQTGAALSIPPYRGGKDEKKILSDYLGSTRAMTHFMDEGAGFMNPWIDRLFQQAADHLAALPIRPMSGSLSKEEVRKAAKRMNGASDGTTDKTAGEKVGTQSEE